MLKLNKMDVARRQLQAALEMWFAEGDPVAIHTLAAAAHEVMSEVAKYLGHQHLGFDFQVESVANSLSWTPKEVRQLTKSAANFFKHADRDPASEMLFDPEWNLAFLALCLGSLIHMGHRLTAIEMAFWIRMNLERPDKFRSTDVATHLTPTDIEGLRNTSRSEFWSYFQQRTGLAADGTLD